MKKLFLSFIAISLMLLTTFSLIGCDFSSDKNNDTEEEGLPQIDNSVDLKEFTPSLDDDNTYLEDETYYTSSSVDLVTEIHGNYTVDRPFILDKENENKRIYHNIYFYVDDFFQIIYYKKVTDLGTIYAILGDETDKEYAQVEYSDGGAPLQINIIKQGIYDLILDTETFAIDMIKVGDISTPVYEKIKYCELYIHVSLSNYTYSEMTLNKETNEYYIESDLPLNSSIGFFNESHTCRYKMDVEQSLKDRLVYWNFNNTDSVNIHVGGRYKIYFNAKTYVLRLELQNPETANYFCQVEWNKNNILSPVNSTTPYLFEYEFVAQGTPTDPYVDLPNFYPKLGMKYALSLIDEDEVVISDYYLEDGNTYKLTVNLLDFTLTVKKI